MNEAPYFLLCDESTLRNSFWNEFRSVLSSQSKKYGASFMDLTDSPRYVITDYLDTVHLNANGGQKLFETIADKVRTNPSLGSLLQDDTTSGSRKSAATGTIR